MISAIVLAAGESRRMGSHKILLPFRNSTVIEHIVRTLDRHGIEEIIVVTGHRSQHVTAALRNTIAKTIVNEDYLSGMLSSVRCGLRAASSSAEAFLIVLGDQPSLRPMVVERLIAEFTADHNTGDQAMTGSSGNTSGETPGRILVPTFEGHRGHPLLFGSQFRMDVLGRFDESGLRGLLTAFPECIREVTVSQEGILRDMDYPAEYERELRLDVQDGHESGPAAD